MLAIQIYNLNAYVNDVVITHEGDASPLYLFGNAHVCFIYKYNMNESHAEQGSHIIPLKANGKFDCILGLGHNNVVRH